MKVKQSTPKPATITITLDIDEEMAVYSAISGEALVDDETAQAAKSAMVGAMKDEVGL